MQERGRGPIARRETPSPRPHQERGPSRRRFLLAQGKQAPLSCCWRRAPLTPRGERDLLCVLRGFTRRGGAVGSARRASTRARTPPWSWPTGSRSIHGKSSGGRLGHVARVNGGDSV